MCVLPCDMGLSSRALHCDVDLFIGQRSVRGIELQV